MSAIFFVLGKLTFIPSVCYVFSGKEEEALISICIYSFFILMSIVLSCLAISKNKIDTTALINKIKTSNKNNLLENQEATYTVIVKDGKVIQVK
tara:strand:+ start:103 stop:384 length:282 start_codon:yes stop_codon:yes gene_type:complete